MAWIQVPLHVFFEVAQCGNFTQAAKRLHITQSAVSQQIKSLEQELGTTLVDRSNRREIRLTASGHIVYEHARRILQIEEEMKRRIEDVSQVVRGTLTIGASFTMGEYILPMLLTEFGDLYPEIEYQVEIYNTPAVAHAVGERRLDMGLVESVVSHSGVVHVDELAQDELVVIVPVRHRLSLKEQVDPKELSDETWIVREQGSGTREFTDQIFKAHGIFPKRVVAFSSTQSVKEAVRAGLGIALISLWALQTELIFRTVHVLRWKGTSLSRPLSLVTPPRAVSGSATRLFSDFVRNRFQNLSVEKGVHVKRITDESS